MAGPRALATLVLLWWQRTPRQRAAIAALERARAAHRRGPMADPLQEISPDIHRVDPSWLRAGPEQEGQEGQEGKREGGPLPDAAPLPVTVVHLLGTAEIRHAPLPGLRRMCRIRPQLARCRHLIADTSADPGAFLGADEFAVRMARVLTPALSDCSDGLVFSGLSRGALTALELGTRLGAEHDQPVQIVACAPPVRCDYELPLIVRRLAALEPSMHLVSKIMRYPSPLNVLWRLWLRRLFVRNTGLVLGELGMDGAAWVAWYARYAETQSAPAICLRALREFALLVRVSDAELRHMVAALAERVSDAERVFVTLCWGEQDSWVPSSGCLARVQQSFARHGVPAARAELRLLPGWDHGMGRQEQGDYAELAGIFDRAVVRAAACARGRDGGMGHVHGG